MRLMVIAAPPAQALWAGLGDLVERCASTGEALATLAGPCADIGCILVDVQASPGGGDGVAEDLREHGVELPIAVVRLPGQPAPRHQSVPPLCAVETTDDGMHILRCALHQRALRGAPAPREGGGLLGSHATGGGQPVVFEYHAPCRKAR